MAEGKMPYMQANGGTYKPPTGSAGKKAFGEYSSKKNPLSEPKKGSEIKAYKNMGMNSDKEKVKRMESEQARAENLRGIGC